MNLDKLFHLKENHTDVKTEVMAGITTFLTMAYILAVNPTILEASGMDRGAVFTATALVLWNCRRKVLRLLLRLRFSGLKIRWTSLKM